MPEYVQFKNGNVIKNLYNAGGQKLRSDYYTRITAITPLADGAVLNPVYNSTDYSYTGTAYVDNNEYSISKTYNSSSGYYTDSYTYGKAYTPEGYVTILSNPQYHYFRKDHLGNNWEVWLANTNTTLQRTQYYPSGLPWAESTGQSVQNKKYNGKEFVEAHGLDEYDSEARWYYPAIMRTTTLDPLAEKYYSISPYAWCGNNPVRMVDPKGKFFDSFEYNTKTGNLTHENSNGGEEFQTVRIVNGDGALIGMANVHGNSVRISQEDDFVQVSGNPYGLYVENRLKGFSFQTQVFDASLTADDRANMANEIRNNEDKVNQLENDIAQANKEIDNSTENNKKELSKPVKEANVGAVLWNTNNVGNQVQKINEAKDKQDSLNNVNEEIKSKLNRYDENNNNNNQ